MLRRLFLCAFIVVVAITLTLAQTIKKISAPYTNPASGDEMYKAYCASCHGLDGKGRGPAAAAMKVSIPDLTQLSKSKGEFPSAHVAAVIQGDSNAPSHGSAEMPIWGPVFLRVSQSQTAEVQQRVRNLTNYIESMQQK